MRVIYEGSVGWGDGRIGGGRCEAGGGRRSRLSLRGGERGVGEWGWGEGERWRIWCVWVIGGDHGVGAWVCRSRDRSD